MCWFEREMFPIVSDIWTFGPQLVTLFGRFRWCSLARGRVSLALRLTAFVPLCFLLATPDFLLPLPCHTSPPRQTRCPSGSISQNKPFICCFWSWCLCHCERNVTNASERKEKGEFTCREWKCSVHRAHVNYSERQLWTEIPTKAKERENVWLDMRSYKL